MATANETLLDTAVSHQIGLLRFSGHVRNRIVAHLNRVEDDLIRQMRTYSGDSDITLARLDRMLRDVRDILDESRPETMAIMADEMTGLASHEIDYQDRAIRDAVPIRLELTKPTAEQLRAGVMARPFQGKLLREWVSELDDGARRRIRDAVRIGWTEGETIDQMVRRIRGTRAAQYKDGVMEITRRGAQAMVRTAVNHTATYARDALYAANDDLIKGVRWVSTLDARTSALCASRDGKVYPVDSGPRPPAHINCLPGDSPVLAGGRITGASKRWFEGKLVSIRTGNGRELRATPNHPVLTDRGWVGIGRLNCGDKLLCLRHPERASAAFDTGNHDVEALIHEKAEAFLSHGDVDTVPMPTAAPDFHGDGAGSEVAIIGAYRSLGVERQVEVTKEGGHFALERGCTSLSALLRLGALGLLVIGARPSPHCIVGSPNQHGALCCGSSVHSGLLLLATVSQGKAFFTQDALDGTWADAEFICDPANASAFGVELDDVVFVERGDFAGHVFNLETEKSVYFSGGIITHNCRSTTTPILASWREMGIDIDEAPPGTRASLDGQVPAETTYAEWLKRQPVSVQDEVLGKTKATLFRKGGMEIGDFVDTRGNVYNLDQLRARDAAAFARAGL